MALYWRGLLKRSTYDRVKGGWGLTGTSPDERINKHHQDESGRD